MTATTTTAARVQMIGISQTFGSTTVLHDVNLSVQPGEIHALVGQNGAGKSTLMKILGGIYPEHDGTILIDGVDVPLTSPRDALRNGIGIIYQELSLIPSLTVAENVMLGIEPGRGGYSRARTVEAASTVLARVPMLAVLPPKALASSLSTGLQQRVEIAKALARDVKVLVMDEPTARLSGPERDDLRNLMLELAASGIAIIYISHFLEEIFESCSIVTIMRNGRVVDSGPIGQYTLGSLTTKMLNAELAAEEFDPENSAERASTGEPIIELAGVSGPRVKDISFTVNGGEIVGLVGLVGSGRTRVAKTLVGAEPASSGSILVAGKVVKFSSPRDALAHGVVMIPENRKTEGIVGIASGRENMISMALDRGMARGGLVNGRAATAAVKREFAELEIRPNNPKLAGERFSGGNQQKILLARAFLAKPRVLVADQPTAGVDVGTKAQIHRLLKSAADAGTGVVVVSDDLDEILALCDRVLVMKTGRVISEHRRSTLDRTKLVEAIASED